MNGFIRKSIPFYAGFVFFIAGCALSFLFVEQLNRQKTRQNEKKNANTTVDCEVTSTRMGGFEYVKPLLFVEKDCESPNLKPIKDKLSQQIEEFKKNGDILSASVYLRVFDHGEWTGVNINQAYHPGSLFKIPILIAYLRMAESDPGLLDRIYLFERPKGKVWPVQNYLADTIQEGKRYTVRELLRYAVAYSDNNAHYVLSQHLDEKVLEDLFIDLGLGLPVRDEEDGLIHISAKSYSAFMKTLFNSTYLNPKLSDFAMSLMGECSFKDGFIQGLPANTKVAHKFGEWDNTQEFELHESGVIYVQNRPYLLTIMTKGKSRARLPLVISNLTKTVYKEMLGS